MSWTRPLSSRPPTSYRWRTSSASMRSGHPYLKRRPWRTPPTGTISSSACRRSWSDAVDLCRLTIHEMRELLLKREVSSTEIVRSVLDRIAQVDGQVKAYVTLTEETALKQAGAVDRKSAARDVLPPLAGIPLAIKDVLCTKGVHTTCSSKILQSYLPPYDATALQRLKAQDAVP